MMKLRFAQRMMEKRIKKNLKKKIHPQIVFFLFSH